MNRYQVRVQRVELHEAMVEVEVEEGAGLARILEAASSACYRDFELILAKEEMLSCEVLPPMATCEDCGEESPKVFLVPDEAGPQHVALVVCEDCHARRNQFDREVHAPLCAQRFIGAAECTCHVARAALDAQDKQSGDAPT